MFPRPQHYKSWEQWAERLTQFLERQNQVKWLAERFEQGANLTFTYNPGKETITIEGNVGGTDLSYDAATRLLSSSTGADVTLPLVVSANAGLAPASGGGTSNFLRADGTWDVPPGATNLTYTAATRLLESSTGSDVTLPLVSSSDAGLAPASGGGTTNFLRADGTWAVPAGGSATDLTYTASTRLLESSTGTDVTLPLFTSTDAGLTPSSGGGTTNFLRADGTWAAPAGGSATDLTYTASTRLLESSTGTDVTLPLVTSSDAGLAPASGGGTENFLRADATWAAPVVHISENMAAGTQAASASASAAKGVVCVASIDFEIIAVKARIGGAGTYNIAVAIVDSGDLITSIAGTSGSVVTSASDYYHFDLTSAAAITAGDRFAILLVRTDGTATSVNQLFVSATTGPVGFGYRQIDLSRFDSVLPAVGDNVTPTTIAGSPSIHVLYQL